MSFLNEKEESKIIDLIKLRKMLELSSQCRIHFTNHHYSHVLGAFYFTTWKDKSLYLSADGGGDGAFYSAHYFDGKKLNTIYGSDTTVLESQPSQASIGQAYSIVTELLGFKRNRHEGKITGLAAFGKPEFSHEILDKFSINNDYSISSVFGSIDELKEFLTNIYSKTTDEVLAASIQKATEELIVKWIENIKNDFDVEYIGLSGGVFSNVKLNQEISLIDGIKEIFVLPPMGDEGLPIGNIIDYLIVNNGIENVISNRSKMSIPYFGRVFKKEDVLNSISSKNLIVYDKDDYLDIAADLLKDKIGAIFYKGMEMGPRALGARSIIASPVNRGINDSLNNRLDRSDFMPFAPFVRDIDANSVYELDNVNLYASKFMTITTNVKDEFKDKIPAVVHIDGTARPQVIYREDNYIYYDILTKFYEKTGIPTLVNTSFNAHEEPIINTPEEAIIALEDDRVDFLIFEDILIYKQKNLLN